ncbi:hypothetical protein [Rhodococcus qingshengii]|uniref:hypothetical protein n=1 Tax=Rhodococcus qingshengii TaxID=334542 RepID=UPI001ADFDF75|nr:hypothetical protein [Rhodococcus qingshengii]MCQ4150260.1 hypothetical protein [Rhodococcus qingshengii]
MTHTQNTVESTLAQTRPCPLSSPLGVLGAGPTPILDRLTHEALTARRDPVDTATEYVWPDETDVDSRDEITIDRGEIHFSDESQPEEETDSEDGPHIEPVPPFVTGTGAIIAGTCSVIILIVVGILFVASHFGGVA